MMKKLFSKIEKLLEEENQTTQVKQESIIVVGSSIDQEINKAVFSAQDEILKEVQKILDETKTDKELGFPDFDPVKIKMLQKLTNLGFVNQPEAKKLQQELDEYHRNKNAYLEELRKSRKLKETVEYYQKTYPNQRFITHESIKSICNRFGLLFAPVGMYQDEIPLKNMKDIVDFQVDSRDLPLKYRVFINSDELAEKISGDDKKGKGKLSFIRQGVELVMSFDQEFESEELLLNEIYNTIKQTYGVEIPTWGIHTRRIDAYMIQFHQKENLLVPLHDGMMIAPKNKFKIPEGYQVFNGFEVGYAKVVEIKDPVVLQPVKGGYLIVTAWGFEETLPEISGTPDNTMFFN